MWKATPPAVQVACYMEATFIIAARVHVHGVNDEATPCDVLVHTKLEVKVGKNIASATMIAAACRMT